MAKVAQEGKIWKEVKVVLFLYKKFYRTIGHGICIVDLNVLVTIYMRVQ